MLRVNRREAFMACGVSHRDVTKERFWREQIGGQPGSGLSVRGYCRRHRLRESAFYFWRKELSRRGVSVASGRSTGQGHAPGGEPTFVPIRLTVDSPGQDTVVGDRADDPVGRRAGSGPLGRIEIVLGNDRCVRLLGPVDRQSLAAVLAVLEGERAERVEEGRRC
jgi:hypothetical protein